MYTVKEKQLGGFWDWFQSNITISKQETGPIRVTVGPQNPPPAPPPVTVIQQPQQLAAPLAGMVIPIAIGIGALLLFARR